MGVESAVLILSGGMILLFFLRVSLALWLSTASTAIVVASDSRMMVCPVCGSQNDVAYTFCSECASKLSVMQYTSSPLWGYFYF